MHSSQQLHSSCDFFSQRCDGDALETCAGGKLARRDCAAAEPAGQRCGFHQSGPFAGAAACGLVATPCDLDADEHCDGDVLAYCDLGEPATVDCRAAGYSGCATRAAGARTIAYCTP